MTQPSTPIADSGGPDAPSGAQRRVHETVYCSFFADAKASDAEQVARDALAVADLAAQYYRPFQP